MNHHICAALIQEQIADRTTRRGGTAINGHFGGRHPHGTTRKPR